MFAVESVDARSSVLLMRQWSITLHGPAGILSSVDAAESQFVIGTETASDVFTVVGDGVKARHAWVWIGEAGMQVEDLGGGTLVNGYQISERVQVEYPASVQVGEVTLVIEVKEVQPAVVSPTVTTQEKFVRSPTAFTSRWLVSSTSDSA